MSGDVDSDITLLIGRIANDDLMDRHDIVLLEEVSSNCFMHLCIQF